MKKKEPAEKMLSEKIPPAGIRRVPGISESRLQNCAIGISRRVPDAVFGEDGCRVGKDRASENSAVRHIALNLLK